MSRHCHVIVKGSALDCQATPIGAIGELGLVGGAGAAAKVALYLSGHIDIDNDRQCDIVTVCHCQPKNLARLADGTLRPSDRDRHGPWL